MKINYFTCLSALLLLITTTTDAQPIFRWADAMPGYTTNVLPDQNNIGPVIINQEGDVYAGGYFLRGMDFDPTSGVDSLYADAMGSGFWAKYDSSGHLLWAHNLSGVTVQAACMDDAGNYYIAGSTTGTDSIGLGNSQVSVTVTGGSDLILAKYDATDHLVWVKHAGSGQNTTQIEALKADASGNIYVTGDFFGTVDFDPAHPGTQVRNSSLKDGFIARFDASGNLTWVRQIKGSDGDQGNGLDIDPSGNIVVTGYTANGQFAGNVSFEDAGQQNVSVALYGQYDAFVAKYTANGDLLWAKTMGSVVNDFGNCIVTDAGGNIYVGGYYTDTFRVDNMPLSSVPLANNGAFFVKLNASGGYVWSKFYGQDTGVNKIALVRTLTRDDSGYIYTSGSFVGTIVLDPAQPPVTSQARGINAEEDAFVIKMDTAGNYKWTQHLYGKRDMAIYSLQLDPSYNIYMGGYVVDSTDFNRGGTGGLIGFPTPNPNWVPVSFLAKYAQPGPNAVNKLISGSRAITLYPNPANNYIMATGTIKVSDILTVRDVLGRACPVAITVQAGRAYVDTHMLRSGMYVLQLSSDNDQSISIRFVKQ